MDELIPIKCPKCNWRFIVRVDLTFREKILLKSRVKKMVQIAICPQCLRSLGISTRTRKVEVVKHPSLFSSVMIILVGAIFYAVTVIVRILKPDIVMTMNYFGLISMLIVVTGCAVLIKRILDKYKHRYVL